MGYLTGLMMGGSDALSQHSQNLNRMRDSMAADRRYREGLRIRESEFSRTLAQRKTEHEETIGLNRERLNEETRQFDKTHEQRITEHAEKMDVARKTEEGLNRRFDRAQQGIDRRFDITDKRERDQFNKTLTFDREKFGKTHGLAKQTLRESTRQAQEDLKLRRRIADDQLRYNTETLNIMRERDRALEAYRNETNALKRQQLLNDVLMYNEELQQAERFHKDRIGLGYAELRGRTSASKSARNLDSNIVSVVGDLGNRHAIAIHNQIHRGSWWNLGLAPNEKLDPIQQVERFESLGKTVAKDILALSGGDVNEALRYVPHYINSMFLSDKKEAQNFHKMIERTVPEGEAADKWKRDLRDALYRGILQEWKIPYQKPADIAPKTMSISQPRGVIPALKDWGSYVVDPKGAGQRVATRKIDEFIKGSEAKKWDANRIIKEGIKKFKPFHLYSRMGSMGYDAEALKIMFQQHGVK